MKTYQIKILVQSDVHFTRAFLEVQTQRHADPTEVFYNARHSSYSDKVLEEDGEILVYAESDLYADLPTLITNLAYADMIK